MGLELSASTTGLLLVVAIVMAGAAITLAALALAGQRRVRAAYRTFSLGRREDVLTLLQQHVDEVRGLRGDVGDLRRYADELRRLISGGISRVATVRYDAFDDMGGRMSFSAALLDEQGDGIVISSINGRTETRTYAKPVVATDSRHNLSREEIRAIEEALAGTQRSESHPAQRPARKAVRRPARKPIRRAS